MVGSIALGVALFLLWLALGWPPLIAWVAGWTPVAFAAYGIDERAAVRKGWRILEAALHGLALVGGVIGAGPGVPCFVTTRGGRCSWSSWWRPTVLWGAIVARAILG